MTDAFEAKELLSPPNERAAFSDRQAYVCAELSQLAYFEFSGSQTLAEVVRLSSGIVSNQEELKELEERLAPILKKGPNESERAREAFSEILETGDFKLEATFSRLGTQAFLCSRIDASGTFEKKIGYVCFRGTEPTDFRDIKTDVNASLQTIQLDGISTRVHRGYLKALQLIEDELVSSIEEKQFDQLFITGHSLGGALAILFTRMHFPDSHGACYTFGAPPVGGVEVQYFLKTPVYQIINEVDIVPRLPNPILVAALRWIARAVFAGIGLFSRTLHLGKWDESLIQWLEEIEDYRHPGYLSYLEGPAGTARLRYNVSIADQIRWSTKLIGKRLLGFRKLVSDHDIELYIEKLKSHAQRRQYPKHEESGTN